MSNKKRHVAIYLRLSRAEDGAEANVDSLRNHREKLISICENNGYSYEIFSDGISSSQNDERIEFNKMLSEIKADKFQAIACHHQDRLSRKNSTLSALSDTLVKHCPVILTATSTFDLETEEQKLLFNFQSIIAEQEYNNIKKRMQLGLFYKAQKGYYLHSNLPYGYSKKDGKLVPNVEEKAVYDYAIDLLLSGMSYALVASKLAEEKITRRNGNKFSGDAIREFVIKEVYRGIIVYNSKYGTARVEDAHEPLISTDNYLLISEMGRKRASTHNRTRSKSTYVSSSLFFCKNCGKRLALNSSKDYVRRNGVKTDEYKVSSMLKGCRFGCVNYGTSLRIMENAVIEELQKYTEGIREELSKIKMQDTEEFTKHYKKKIAEAEKELRKVKKSNDNLVTLFVDDLIDKATFVSRQDAFNEKIHHLNTVVSSAKQSMENLDTTSTEERLERMLKNITELQTTKQINDSSLSDADKKAKITYANNILKNIIAKVHYSRSDLKEVPNIEIEFM